jgi:sigma-B regulation protein RsbU (phosphoserine phosphatase)
MPEAGAWVTLSRVALGFILAWAGLAALVLSISQRRRGALALFSFGWLALLYGAQFLLSSPLITPELGLSRRTLLYANAWIGYALPIAGLLYAEQVRGRGWYSSLRYLWQLSIVVAIALVINDVSTGVPFAAAWFYGLYVIVVMAVLLPHVIFARQRDRVESQARTIGTGTLVVTIVYDLLSAFGVLPPLGQLEVFGVGVFLLSLGFVTTRRMFADQRELAVVERELTMAQSIQSSILPRDIPLTTGLDVAVRYLPARTVAGDVYGFLQIDEHRLGVLVADVTGHGMPAALIASMTSVLFSAQAEWASDPARLLAGMNRSLSGRFDAQFVTAAYVYIDTERHCLRYSLAGHPPPILREGATGHLARLPKAGLILGVFPDATYPTAEMPFRPGDRLVLFTDGLTDATSPSGAWFGDHELPAFLEAHGPDGASVFATALTAHLARWSGREGEDHPYQDDVTVIVIDGVMG